MKMFQFHPIIGFQSVLIRTNIYKLSLLFHSVLDLTRENEEGEGQIMGSLTVTVQALEAIQSLYE